MSGTVHAMLSALQGPDPDPPEDVLTAWNPPNAGAAAPPARTRRQKLAKALAAVVAAVDVQDLQVLAGLLLLGRGCYLLHPAAGYIAPGAVLLWWALPQRPRFVVPRPPDVRIVTPDEYQKGAPKTAPPRA